MSSIQCFNTTQKSQFRQLPVAIVFVSLHFASFPNMPAATTTFALVATLSIAMWRLLSSHLPSSSPSTSSPVLVRQSTLSLQESIKILVENSAACKLQRFFKLFSFRIRRKNAAITIQQFIRAKRAQRVARVELRAQGYGQFIYRNVRRAAAIVHPVCPTVIANMAYNMDQKHGRAAIAFVGSAIDGVFLKSSTNNMAN